MISYNLMQGETVNTFSKSDLKSRGYWRAPYVQLLYRERIKRVAVTNQTLLTPSIVMDRFWVGIDSPHPQRVYGKWLLFVDKKQLNSVWQADKDT